MGVVTIRIRGIRVVDIAATARTRITSEWNHDLSVPRPARFWIKVLLRRNALKDSFAMRLGSGSRNVTRRARQRPARSNGKALF
jgi:hypothetical protein